MLVKTKTLVFLPKHMDKAMPKTLAFDKKAVPAGATIDIHDSWLPFIKRNEMVLELSGAEVEMEAEPEVEVEPELEVETESEVEPKTSSKK